MVLKLITAAASLFFCLEGNIYAQVPGWKLKVSPSLLSAFAEKSSENFIVIMNDQADVSAAKYIHGKEEKGKYVFETLRNFSLESQKSISTELNEEQIAFTSFWVVNALSVTGSLSDAEKLASRDDVKKILPNAALSYEEPISMKTDNTRDDYIPWGVDTIHAPQVWAMGYQGQGVVVGGADTGYDWEHPALKNQYRGWNGDSVDHNYNWHDAIHAPDPHNIYSNPCGIDLQIPCDDFGHGTHTMGTMVGEDGIYKIGVAPQARWIGERNMEQGWGNLTSYIEAFQWFIAPTDLLGENPDPSKAPHVINNSWVCTSDEGCDASNFSLMEDAVNNVKAAGIVVVASAGNSGPDCNTISNPPAIFEGTFSVGAIDYTKNIAWFSSRGNVAESDTFLIKPDVVAPGVDVVSCIPNDQYASFSGTSMAGPHVAGTVALIISANPLLAGEVDEIENIIRQTAHPVTTNDGCGNDQSTSIPNNTYGYGIIDALAAVQQATVVTSSEIDGHYVPAEVFPTVTRDLIHVNQGNSVGSAVMEIWSEIGKYTGSIQLHGPVNIIHLSDLTSGMYLYRIFAGGNVSSGKIVKL